MSPVGIYVHIPFCKSKCKYCAFVSTPDLSLEKRYVDVLCGEIAGCSARGIKADTVYIGGGTPSCLFRGGLTRILGSLRASFDISRDAEITVECNPESVTQQFVDECRACGVNRVSMGLQSSNDDVLCAVGRPHRYADYIRAVELLGTAFDNISSDIILGLPGQTADDVTRSIETVDKYCTHMSVYALSVERGTPLYNGGYTVDDDFVADLYDLAVNELSARGFERYEVSNFAKNGKISRHNARYWNCLPYIGFGVAAHGYDGRDTRYAHGDCLSEYLSSPQPKSVKLSATDMYNEYVMLRLRTADGIDDRSFKKRFGYSFISAKSELISDYERKGYVVRVENGIKIAPRYMFVMNGIIEDFMI